MACTGQTVGLSYDENDTALSSCW